MAGIESSEIPAVYATFKIAAIYGTNYDPKILQISQ
jgi:hypothetical protein